MSPFLMIAGALATSPSIVVKDPIFVLKAKCVKRCFLDHLSTFRIDKIKPDFDIFSWKTHKYFSANK